MNVVCAGQSQNICLETLKEKMERMYVNEEKTTMLERVKVNELKRASHHPTIPTKIELNNCEKYFCNVKQKIEKA